MSVPAPGHTCGYSVFVDIKKNKKTGTRTLLWTDPGIRGQRAWPVLCLIASSLVLIFYLKKTKTKTKNKNKKNELCVGDIAG